MYVYFLNRVETEVVAGAMNKKDNPQKREKHFQAKSSLDVQLTNSLEPGVGNGLLKETAMEETASTGRKGSGQHNLHVADRFKLFSSALCFFLLPSCKISS